jgi:hypothetical protein
VEEGETVLAAEAAGDEMAEAEAVTVGKAGWQAS